MFVSVGLMRMLENEAQLAGVLGHEIAHITHRHAIKTLERNKKIAGFGALTVSMLGQSPDVFDKVIEQAGEIIFTYGLDKNLEYEADKMGTEYANRLGYNSDGLKKFLENLDQSQSAKNSVFLSTHPSPRDRLNKLSETRSSGNSDPLFADEYKQATQGKI